MGSLHGRVDPLAARLLAFLWLLSNRQRKARSGLSSMTKREDVLPQLIFCDLYLALFESHLRYDNVVWCSISSSELQARAKKPEPYRLLSSHDLRIYGLTVAKRWSFENLIRFQLSVMVQGNLEFTKKEFRY